MTQTKCKLWIAVLAVSLWHHSAATGYDGKLTISVADEATDQPIPVRMELRNGRGRPVRIEVEGAISRDDYIAFDGQIELELPRDSYQFFLEAGPEYHTREGHFTIDRHAEDSTSITLKRHTHMAEQGWWAGDVDVDQRPHDLPLLMRAAGISITQEFAAEKVPLAEAWNLPVLVASDKLDAVQIISRNTLPGAKRDVASRTPDKVFFPGRLGRGRFNEAIYHHLLNCGLRIPPAAGSGSGVNQTPIGTNRVYVHGDEEFSQETWLEGLRAGRIVVTNGPLLRTSVEGQPPGAVFHLDKGQSRQFQIALSLSFYEKARVEYLEIVKNGRVEYEVRLDELAKKSGQLPPLEFSDSGWFLVRAVANNSQLYQYATTGPYYVEANYQSRISRASVEYFLAWLDEAAKKFARKETVLADITAARPFWEDMLNRANAD